MSRKLSYYTVFSEPVNSKNETILFCTRTAQAVKISEETKERLLSGRLDDMDQSFTEHLEKIKAVVTAQENELEAIIKDNNRSIDASTELYEIIQPTAMCQLGCDYCGQNHTKDYIPNDIYKKLLTRIEHKITSGSYKSLFIGWFGAEPLVGLKQIRELSAELKAIAKTHDLAYGAKMVTNGLSLKKNIFIELATAMSVKQIEVTLDGIAPYHDQRRHTKEKKATFDLIFSNLLDILNMPNFHEYGCRISIRCNVDERNIDGVSPLIKLLAEHELQNKIAYFYPIGVYSWGGNEAHKKSLTKEEFAEIEIGWMMEMLENGFIPQLLPSRSRQVCMAVSPVSEMYDAFGNIFKCTEVSYSSNYHSSPYILGNLRSDESHVEKNNILQRWNSDVENNKFPCSTCKMLPVCGGGCPKSWHEDMRACPSAKFNIKSRLALSYLASQMDMTKVDSSEIFA